MLLLQVVNWCMARYAFACHLHTTADDGFLCPNWETHRSVAASVGRDTRGASADGLARPCRQTLGFVSREPVVELGDGCTFINVKVVVIGSAETEDALFQGTRIASPSCVRTVRGGPIVNLPIGWRGQFGRLRCRHRPYRS